MVWSKNESRMGCRRMIGREKVITGLELCTNISPDGCLMLCPYKDEKDETYSGFCEQVLKQDALALLKEQGVTQKDGYNLQELWKRARAGETLNETELNFLIADWDERNIFKQQEAIDEMVKPTKCPCGELFDAKDSSFCPKCGCAYGELSGRYTNIGR